MVKAIIIHGNGGGTGADVWYPYVRRHLEQAGVEAIAPDFPDSYTARSAYWIPYLRDVLKADAQTIIIGHSSGAVCAMRYAEMYPILGSVLVGASYTDLGIENERLSGYYDKPWNWDLIRKNQKWIVEFASSDDPWIPIEEARHIHEKLKTDYFEYSDRGHFGGDRDVREFKECVDIVKKKLNIK